MNLLPSHILRWLFDPNHGAPDRLLPRCLFLRALGVIYFSAFFSLIFQIRGLIGSNGILPASEYLRAVTNSVGFARFWYAPTLLWFSTSNHTLMAICWTGLVAPARAGMAPVRIDHDPVCAISPPNRRSRRRYSAIAPSSAARSKSGQ